jgi:hypothetical protein
MNTNVERNSLSHSEIHQVLPMAFPLLTAPEDVVCDASLTLAEKRSILASWASDSRAVTDDPTLRRLDNGAVVRVGDVLRALRSLDDAESRDGPHNTINFSRSFSRRKYSGFTRWLRELPRHRRSDDDDDPPPCPVIARLPPGGRPPLEAKESLILEAVA